MNCPNKPIVTVHHTDWGVLLQFGGTLVQLPDDVFQQFAQIVGGAAERRKSSHIDLSYATMPEA